MNDLSFLDLDFSCLQQVNKGKKSLEVSKANTAASIKPFAKLIRFAVHSLSLPGHGSIMQWIFSLNKTGIAEELIIFGLNTSVVLA